MLQEPSCLSDISLVTNNFGDELVLEDILQDWFHFLGGKPGEVVIVNCGSSLKTQQTYWQLYQKGLIDKFQIIQADHEDNYGGKETGYIQEYTAGAIASKPYILWFHVDTLPYRQGHEDWLQEAIYSLDRDDVFAVGGSFNLPSKHHDAWAGWYFSHKCSLNFALMKRDTYRAALHEFADDFIRSGFKAENPAGPHQNRFIIELALESYIQRHQAYTLCKIEDPNWTVFHTNVHEEQLRLARKNYLARRGIDRFINIGLSDAEPDPTKALYYGQPSVGLFKKLRIMFGQTSLGLQWRKLKQRLMAEAAST